MPIKKTTKAEKDMLITPKKSVSKKEKLENIIAATHQVNDNMISFQ